MIDIQLMDSLKKTMTEVTIDTLQVTKDNNYQDTFCCHVTDILDDVEIGSENIEIQIKENLYYYIDLKEFLTALKNHKALYKPGILNKIRRIFMFIKWAIREGK